MTFRVRTLWLALKALFVVALTAGGTVAPSSVFAYDAPVFARVDLRQLNNVDAGETQLSAAREGSASRPFEAGGASTTPSPRSVATEAASPGGIAIVIGEDMEGRIIPKANELGADYYDPPTAPRDQWMENNRKWINDRMDEGCTIYDCGPAPGRANYPSPTSPYYQMELDEIAKRSYPVIRVS